MWRAGTRPSSTTGSVWWCRWTVQPVCSCVPDAAFRSSCAVAVIAATGIAAAPAGVRRTTLPGARQPVVTSARAVDACGTPHDHSAGASAPHCGAPMATAPVTDPADADATHKVTHQGCPPWVAAAPLAACTPDIASTTAAPSAHPPASPAVRRCYRCAGVQPEWLRQGFLRHGTRAKSPPGWRHDHSP